MDPTVSRSSAVSSKYVEKTYYCETCKLSVMGREEYSDHLASVMHRLNLDRLSGRVRGAEGSRNSSEKTQPREPERRDREKPKGSASGSIPADPFLRDTSLDEASLRDEMLEATLANFYGINNTDSPIQIGKDNLTAPSRSYDRGARSDSRERSSSYDRDHRSSSYDRDQAYSYDSSRSSYDRSGRGSSQRTGSAEWNRQDYEFSRGRSPLSDKSDHSSRLHDVDRRYSAQYSQSSDAASRRYSGYDDRGYTRDGSPHRDSSRSYGDRPVDRASYRSSDVDRDDRTLYSDVRYSDSSRLRSASDRFDDDRTQMGQSQRYPPRYADEQFHDGTRSNYRHDDRRVDRSPIRDRHSRDLTPDRYKTRDYTSGSIRESSVDRNNGPPARDAGLDISDPALTAIELLKSSGITDDAAISETAASIISQVLDGNFSLLPFGQNEEERPKTQKVKFVDQVQVQEIPASGKSRKTPYDEKASRQAGDPFYPKTPKPTFDSPDDSPVTLMPETPRPSFDSSSSESGNSPANTSVNLKVIPPYEPAYSAQTQEQPMDISPIHDAPSPSPSPSPPPPPPPPPPPKDKQQQQPKPVAAPQSQPVPVAAPQSQPVPVAAPKSKPMPVAAPQSQPMAGAAPHTQPMPVPAPQSQPLPVAAPQSQPLPVAAAQNKPIPVAAPQSQPTPVAAPQSQPTLVAAAPQNQSTPVAALPNTVAPVVTPQTEPGSTQPQPVAAPQITQQPTTAALAVDQQSNAIAHLQQQLGAALLQQAPADPNATIAQQQQTIAALQSLQQLGVALHSLQQANPGLLMPQIPGLIPGNQNPPDAAKNQNSDSTSDQPGDDMAKEKRQTYREHREQAAKQGGDFGEDYAGSERRWSERGRGSWPGRGWSSDTRGRGGWGDRGGRGGWGYGNRGGWGEWGERGRGRPDRGRGYWGDGSRGRGWGRGGYSSGSDPSWVTDASPDSRGSKDENRDRDRDRDRLNNRNPDGSRISRFDQPKDGSSNNLRSVKELPKIPKRESQTIPGARSLKSFENAERDKVMRLVNKPRSYTERVQIAKILHNHQQRTSKSRFSSHSSQHRPRGTTPLEIFNAGGVLKVDDLPEEVQREIAALLEREAEGDSDAVKPPEPRDSSDRRTSADSRSSGSSAATVKREDEKPPVKKLRCEHMLGDRKENEITPELLKDRKFKPRVKDPSLTTPASMSMRSLIDEILVDVKREKEDTINLKTSSNVDVKMDLSNLSENQIDMSFEKMDVDDDNKVGGKRRRAESPTKSLSADATDDDASKRRRVEGDGAIIIKSDPDELLKEGGPVAETLLKLSLHEEEIKRRLKLANAAISRLEALAKRTVEQIAQRQSMRKKLIKEEMRLRKRRLIILKEVKPDTDITEVSSLDLSTSEWDSTSSIGDRLDLGSMSDSKKGNSNVKYMGTLKVDKTNPNFLKELSAKIEPVDNDDTKSQDSDSGSSKDSWFNKYIDKEKSHKNVDLKGSFKKKKSHDRERSKDREREKERERSTSNESDRRKKDKEKKSAFPPPKTSVVLKSKSSSQNSDKPEKRKSGHDKTDRKSEKEKSKHSHSSDSSKSSSYKKSNDSSSSFKKNKDADRGKQKSKAIVDSSSESSDDEFDKRHKKKSRAVIDSSDSDDEYRSQRSRGKKDRGSSRKADRRMSDILKKYLHAPSSSDIDTDSDRKARPVFDITKLKMRPVVELHRINVKEYKRKIRAGIAVSSPKPAKVKLKPAKDTTKPAKDTPKPEKVSSKSAASTSKSVKPAAVEKLYQISPSAVPPADKPLFSDSDSDNDALKIDLSVLDSTPVKSIPPNPAYRIPNKEIKQCDDAKSDKEGSENGDDKDSETKTENSVKMPESVPDSDSVASSEGVKSKESSEVVDMKVCDKKSEADSQEPDVINKPKSQDTDSKELEPERKSEPSIKKEASDTASEKPDIPSKTEGKASNEPGSDAPSKVDTTDENSKETKKLDERQVDNSDVSIEKESDKASPEPDVSGRAEPEDPLMIEDVPITPSSPSPEEEDVPITPSSPSPEEAEAPSTKESDTLDKPEPDAPESPKEVEASKECDNSELESPQSPEEAEAAQSMQESPNISKDELDQNTDVVEKGPVKSSESLEGLLPLHFKGHTAVINAMHVWENYLFTASDDQTARKYDIKTGECVAVYEGHKKGVQCITVFRSNIISPMVFTGSFDCSVRGYNLETSEREARHKFAHRVYCFHQFSEKLYIGLGNGTVACLDVETDKVVETFRCAEGPIRSLATSREGGRDLLVVAANDCSITVRDITNGLLIRTIEGHTKAPTDLKIANNLLYSSAADKTMQVHDLHTGELVETLYHKGVVTSVCLHDDVLLTAGYEGLVRCFNLKSYDQNQLYYGAGHGIIMAMVVQDDKIITGNREGLVEAHTLDRSQHWACQFGLCPMVFGLRADLEHHVVNEHLLPHQESVRCLWTDCSEFLSTKDGSEDAVAHFATHFDSLVPAGKH